MSLAVERLNTFDEACETWNQLIAVDAGATFFSTSTWLQAWWSHNQKDRELLLLRVMRKGTPVGLAPLMIQPIAMGRGVLFLGSGLSDYADFLVDEKLITKQEVVTAVLDFVSDFFKDAIFDFQQIPGYSSSLTLMEVWAKAQGLTFLTVPQDICPITPLPEEPNLYHRQLKKDFLADVRRGERRLRERGTVRIVEHVTPDDGDWTFLRDQMTRLQSQRMQTKGQTPMWQGPLGAFVKDVLQASQEAGSLLLTGLYLNGRMIAYELCFLHNKTVYVWSRAFDEEYRNTGPGKIALLHAIETSIKRGYRFLDLLRGEEPYKELWTREAVQNYRFIFLVRPSLGALVTYKYITSWKSRLQKMTGLKRIFRAIKSLQGS